MLRDNERVPFPDGSVGREANVTCPFEGEDGRERLVAAMYEQKIVGHDRAIAEELAEVVEIWHPEEGEKILTQGALDDDMYFILAGSCAVRVNGRVVAIRERTEQFGEMSLTNPGAPRAATVVARAGTILGKITQQDFTCIAEKHPKLRHGLSQVLASRLEQRNKREKPRNAKPRVFIGSSGESRPFMDVLLRTMEHEHIELVPWTRRDVFKPSSHAIEVLEVEASVSDFAVLVLGPDDRIFSRWRLSRSPRDNVIFELGLFMGALGRRRTFIVEPRNCKLKIPTDLAGITTLRFGGNDDLEERGRSLRETVLNQGPK